MRNLILIICLTATNFCFGQKNKHIITDTIPRVEGKYEYSEVVNTDASLKKADLFKNAKLYFVNTYRSANDVIQYQDEETGKVIGKSFLKVSAQQKYGLGLYLMTFNWDIHYTTEIICKDGKYRYRFYDFRVEAHVIDGNGHPSSFTLNDNFAAMAKKGYYKEGYANIYNNTVLGMKDAQSQLKSYMVENKSAKDEF